MQCDGKIFDGKYIVVGIDGTGSEEWMKSDGSNSYVYRFCKTFNSNFTMMPKHLHGPDSLGTQSLSIGIKAFSIIYEEFQRLVKYSIYSEDKIRIVLVGHSRGGAIAAWVANKLKTINIQVYFIGLYDAVNWSTLNNTDVIKNSEWVFHALNGFSRSRISFLRTARSNTLGYYQEKVFITTHGGIGGDPFPSDNWKGLLPGSDFLANPAYLFEETEKNIELESKNANIWMLQKAHYCGLRFRG